jgi:hypothetical protein
MKRLPFLLLCTVFCCSVLAAPTPPPRPVFYKPGWDAPVDPDKDCKFTQTKDALTIEVPGKDHDLDPSRKQMNAPRLVRDVEGDFRAEVQVSSDWALSNKSTFPGKPAVVGAGLVFLGDKGVELLRFEFGSSREFEKAQRYSAFRIDGSIHHCYLSEHKGWPLAVGAKGMYLRFEREDDEPRVYFGADGKTWVRFHLANGKVTLINWSKKLKVGLAVFSTSSSPLKVRFDHFKLEPLPKRKRKG